MIKYKLLSLKNSYNFYRYYVKDKKLINKTFFKKQKFRSYFLLNKKSLIRNSGGKRFQGLFKKSLSKMPINSIIMPNYRSATLENSIKSVLKQD